VPPGPRVIGRAGTGSHTFGQEILAAERMRARP